MIFTIPESWPSRPSSEPRSHDGTTEAELSTSKPPPEETNSPFKPSSKVPQGQGEVEFSSRNRGNTAL